MSVYLVVGNILEDLWILPDLVPGHLDHYLFGSSDVALILHQDGTAFTYSTLAGVIIVGFIADQESEKFSGTELQIDGGVLSKRPVIPNWFQQLVAHRAREGRKHMDAPFASFKQAT